MELQDGVSAMITCCDRNSTGFEKDVGGVEGGETGGVGQGRGVEEWGKDGFETGCGGGGMPGVDVAVCDIYLE